MAEVANYVALLALGRPGFVEIKGVTFCGSSGGAKLTMQNVPYHADVRAFGQARRHLLMGLLTSPRGVRTPV